MPAITGRHADYVMTVKTDMTTLDKQLKKLPWTALLRLDGQANIAAAKPSPRPRPAANAKPLQTA